MRNTIFISIILLFVAPLLFALDDDTLVQKMSRDNLEVRQARSDYQASLLDVKDARAGMGPTITMTMSGTYMVNPPIGPITVTTQDLLQQMGSQGIDVTPLKGYPDAYLTLYDGMENTLYNFSLDITQPIFTWGKISTAIKLYGKISEVRFADIGAKERKNRSSLCGCLDAIVYLGEMRDLLVEERETAGRLVEITQSMRDNGMVLDEDLLKVRIQAQQVDVGLDEISMQLDNQLLAIRDLVADDSVALGDLEHRTDEQAMEELYAQGRDVLVAKASSSAIDNLQMLALLEEVASMTKDISNASVNWKPDVAIKGSLGYGGSRFPLVESDWYRKDDYTVNLTVAVQATIWDGGKKVRDVKRSETKVETADNNYLSAVRKIRTQVSQSYSAMQLDKSKIAYQNLCIESDGKDAEQKKKQYESGYGNESDWLQAVLRLQNDQFELYRLQLDWATNYRTISYLIGE